MICPKCNGKAQRTEATGGATESYYPCETCQRIGIVPDDWKPSVLSNGLFCTGVVSAFVTIWFLSHIGAAVVIGCESPINAGGRTGCLTLFLAGGISAVWYEILKR